MNHVAPVSEFLTRCREQRRRGLDFLARMVTLLARRRAVRDAAPASLPLRISRSSIECQTRSGDGPDVGAASAIDQSSSTRCAAFREATHSVTRTQRPRIALGSGFRYGSAKDVKTSLPLHLVQYRTGKRREVRLQWAGLGIPGTVLTGMVPSTRCDGERRVCSRIRRSPTRRRADLPQARAFPPIDRELPLTRAGQGQLR